MFLSWKMHTKIFRDKAGLCLQLIPKWFKKLCVCMLTEKMISPCGKMTTMMNPGEGYREVLCTVPETSL